MGGGRAFRSNDGWAHPVSSPLSQIVSVGSRSYDCKTFVISLSLSEAKTKAGAGAYGANPHPPRKRGWCRCNCKGTGAQEQLNKQESKINNRKSLRLVSRIENDNDKMRKNKYQTKVISM